MSPHTRFLVVNTICQY